MSSRIGSRLLESPKSGVLEFLNIFKQPTKEVRLAPPLDGEMLPAINPRTVSIPLYGTKVRAGFPSPADDYVEDRLDLNELLVKNEPATFFLKVEGCSMTGAGIFEGDIIVVDRSLEPSHRDIVLAIIDGRHTIKRLIKRKGEVRL
jgi:DNA polymerase V